MPENNRERLKVALVSALVGTLAWALYVNVEFYDETQTSSWSFEALTNPYLAAQKFIRRGGIDVKDVDSLVKLDEFSGVATLFFDDSNQVQDSRQLNQILDWLNHGGHVIYTAGEIAQEDLLLQEFRVEVESTFYDDGTESDSAPAEKSFSENLRDYNRQIEQGKSRKEIAESESDADDFLTRVTFSEGIGHLDVGFNTDRILSHPYFDADDDDAKYRPFSWSSSDFGVHMMQFDVGDGLLTILVDSGIWTSYRIDQFDNAFLLWLLSSSEGDLAFVRLVLRDSIWNLIGRHATEFLIAMGLFMLLWIWHHSYRFGRLLPRDSSRTRAMAEHFSTISHYLWHRRDADYLIAPLRQRVQRRASQLLAGFTRVDEAQQYELLARCCDLNANTVARAFREKNFNETSFVLTVRLLKRIEQSL